jgi:chemotaxis response regulator CheB
MKRKPRRAPSEPIPAGKLKSTVPNKLKGPAASTARSGKKIFAPAIVGVGASAGGLEALEEFFGAVPVDSDLAFVVVTHQHPGHLSLLPEILGKRCKIPVLAAEDGAYWSRSCTVGCC